MLQKFTVKGDKLALGIGAIVGLDRAQYKDRAHNLKPTPTPGVYETLKPVEFKKGEVIEVSPEGLSRSDQTALGIKDTARAPAKAVTKKAKPVENQEDAPSD